MHAVSGLGCVVIEVVRDTPLKQNRQRPLYSLDYNLLSVLLMEENMFMDSASEVCGLRACDSGMYGFMIDEDPRARSEGECPKLSLCRFVLL